MLGIIFVVEVACACLMISAIEWLRHLRGRDDPRSFEARYLLPILVPVGFVLMLSLYDGKSFPPTTGNVRIVIGTSIGCVLLVLWLLIEATRFRDRPRREAGLTRHRKRARNWC